MPDARERVTKIRCGDREARLARALRENLKRRKARDRVSTSPSRPPDDLEIGRSNDTDSPAGDDGPQRPNPAAKHD